MVRFGERFFILALGTYYEPRRERLRDIDWLHSLQETKGLKLEGPKKQITKRAERNENDVIAKTDKISIAKTLHNVRPRASLDRSTDSVSQGAERQEKVKEPSKSKQTERETQRSS